MILDGDTTDCEACKRLRSGLSWVGRPPRCERHSEYNTTWVGGGIDL